MPHRRCLLTGERTTPDRLLRFAVDAAGAVVPDPAHRGAGRGLWLAPAADAVAAAGARGGFARGARRKVLVPPDLAARSVAAWLAHGAVQVAKARRAGLVLDDGSVPGGDVLTADGGPLGLGRLALRRTPFALRVAADLALLVRLLAAPAGAGQAAVRPGRSGRRARD